MSVRLILALAALAAPAAAAPLCRDLKGLYTPCAPGQAGPRAHKARHEETPAAPRPEAVVAAQPAPVASGRQLVSHSKKLCRDMKGLYTPCPR